MKDIRSILEAPGHLNLGETPEGFDALVLADLARGLEGAPLLHLARDDQRMALLAEALSFFAPDIEVATFPAWDCLPYDRVSPHTDIVARRMATLSRLARHEADGKAPLIVLATVNAALQRVPSRDEVKGSAWGAHVGNRLDLDELLTYLAENGFARTGTVREPGEYAVRGGIVDIFPPSLDAPIRLDLFGDTLDSIRRFDPESQRTTGQLSEVSLVPVSEINLDPPSIKRFRAGYVATFGPAHDNDPLYEAVSEGRKHQGMEHWMPLFHEHLETLFDYAGRAMISLDHQADEARQSRLDLIRDYYEARVSAKAMKAMDVPAYKPLKPEALYLTEDDWQDVLAARRVRSFSPFALPDEQRDAVNLGAREGRSFAPERQQGDVNVFDALGGHILGLRRAKKRVVLASWSQGARERLQGVLEDHKIENVALAEDWADAQSGNAATLKLIVLGLEHGFETNELALISEQDVLGDRLVRRHRKKRAENFLTEASSLTPGDVVVHVDHGIGRFEGLQTVDVSGAPHDCLLIIYHGGDKLYLPVENIELLSRFGSDDAVVQLDRLGGTGWQARKAKLKERLRDMAAQLIKIAAARQLKNAPVIEVQPGVYDEFCARFPYEETEDQEQSIESVLDDLGKGRPMDRLICGDVGFGKTEVALRAAFTAAMAGHQVAVVVPTTLLARQHYKSFMERFAGLPLKIRQLSRLVPNKEAQETKSGLTTGDVDIVIGTHALLSKTIKFRELGLMIVDEEQHFGVKHKERLKELRADVHVLTLTATPIPRTLQLALTGVRELSLITTPPVDRLAVRTFIAPFDGLVVREALLRERYRGGQSFYVCPRISDLAEVKAFLDEHVPELKVAVAHGQMAPGELDDIMNAFYDGSYDVLLSTTIVESGLDIPTANTMIVHRADMFGLAQLYQIRGRVGRSKVRAYALLTLPARKMLTKTAERRLKVLQSLDSLGAGFQLASHDLDIRGGGNLLGEEQSGHIKEVGFELYQQMLEEAVLEMKGEAVDDHGQWSPQIAVGTSVMIPESYVGDLQLRLSLYRRLGELEEIRDIDGFGAELTDRFGPMPEEVEHLLKVVYIKALCRKANIEKLDAGPKGAVIQFRNKEFPDPAGLIAYIGEQGSMAKIRPDQSIVFTRDWPTPAKRLAGSAVLATKLAGLADAVAHKAA